MAVNDTPNKVGGQPVAQPHRRTYAKPVLKVYGPVTLLTSAIDKKGNPDGGPNNTRT